MLNEKVRRRSEPARHNFPPPAFSRKYQARPHPFLFSAPVSKREVQAFPRPTSENWTGLATVLWLQNALEELPASHPSRPALEFRLENEPASPTSDSAGSRRSSKSEPRKPVKFDELPSEVRNMIYCHAAAETTPISPILSTAADEDVQVKSNYIKRGLPVLSQVFPLLKQELIIMLPKFYEANTFQFDLRKENGFANLYRWIELQQDETSSARTISILHYTWYWSSPENGWSYNTDATVFTLTPTGRVMLRRTTGQQDPEACSCDMQDWFFAQCTEWTVNESWTMTDFVTALRDEHELLVQAVTKFAKLVQEHDEGLQMWRKGPEPCSRCSMNKIFFRSFDKIESD